MLGAVKDRPGFVNWRAALQSAGRGKASARGPAGRRRHPGYGRSYGGDTQRREGLEKIESRLSAAATHIAFDMAPGGVFGIEIDGQALPAEAPSLQAVEPVTIAIPDRGRIMIEPAIKNRDKLLGQQRGFEGHAEGRVAGGWHQDRQ